MQDPDVYLYSCERDLIHYKWQPWRWMCDELSSLLEYIGNELNGTRQNSRATAILPESTLGKTMNTEQGGDWHNRYIS